MKLTAKMKEVISLINLNRLDPLDAIERVYKTSSRQSVYSIRYKLFKNELFQKELNSDKAIITSKTADETKRFIDLLHERIPKSEIIERLIQLIRSDDKRVILQAIQEYNRLSNNYPDAKIGLFNANEGEISLTQADYNKLIQQEVEKRINEIEFKKIESAEEVKPEEPHQETAPKE